MSYEVTATRRRPQSFDALVGQEFVAETFRNSIKSKKIAHAYLFTGPRGCGKTSTARILAKALNCAEGPTATPCGHCQQCMEITKGSCTDVIEIDGASNTGVNDVRQIKDEVLFPPQSCRYKVYIIDEVHMLTNQAFNALLKTIEEPPEYVIFIFATTELQKVPATIKSRCQQFNFRLVPIEKVKEQLALAASEVNIKAEDEALFWIARESTGSMRDAYTLFDQVAAFSGDEITYDKIRDKLGLVGVDRLNAIFEDCASNQSQAALEKLDAFLQAGISIEQLISNSSDYLRSLLLIKNGIVKESLLGQSAERFSQKVLQTWNPIQLERALSIFLQLYRDIRYSLSPRYELELAFSRLSWLSQYVSPAEVKVAIDNAKNLLMADAGMQPPQTRPAAAPLQTAPLQPQAPRPQLFAQTNAAAPAPQINAAAQPVASAVQPAAAAPQAVPQPPLQATSPQQVPPSPPRPEAAKPKPFIDLGPDNQSFSYGGAEPPDQSAAQNQFTSEEMPFAEGTYAPDDSAPLDIDVMQEQPTGPVTDMVKLKKAVLSELSVGQEILATTLMQTDGWVLKGNTIYTSVTAVFTQSQLKKQAGEISSIISRYYGSPVEFVVLLRENKSQDISQGAPAEVQLLCSLFRGQIVAKGERTNLSKSAAANNNEDNSDETDNASQGTENSISEEDENESI